MTCGNGTKFRTRMCTGDQCSDKDIEIQHGTCNMDCCPGTNNILYGRNQKSGM